MNVYTLLTSLMLTANVPAYLATEPSFTIEKTFSDRQVRQIERKVRRAYDIPVKITIYSRNANDEITNLAFIRYQKDGQKGGGCSSDKFGRLIITKDGCKIADAGHEANMATN